MADASHQPRLELDTDVLIIGGGMAGAWAAVAARQAGAEVVLVDKGWCGTSGVTAAAGPGHWWVEPEQRDSAVETRAIPTLGLADKRWMRRILEETWEWLPTLAPWYDFGTDDNGKTWYGAVRGPEYMRALRQRIEQAGVTILDHSPALELLRRADGSIAGARGWQTRQRRDWQVRAAGVILAAGGCAFRSHLLGSGNNTGDGFLMAAEAGAELSGMEFSREYCIAQAHTGMTRSMIYSFATYYDASGQVVAPVEGPDPSMRTAGLAQALQRGPVYCSLRDTPEDIREQLPEISPNVQLLFDRAGLRPYEERFEVTLRAEGTIRGTGGLRVIDEHCQTHVPGLYAIGDSATRVLVAGANTGGGAVNAAWALSSGIWAGRAVAALAQRAGRRLDEPVAAIGQAGLRPSDKPRQDSTEAARISDTVRNEMLPLEKNFFRTGEKLQRSLDTLDATWDDLRRHLGGAADEQVRNRESAALVATARWCYRAALERKESRGLHFRSDLPQSDDGFAYRLATGGLDQVWVRREENPAQPHVQPRELTA
ncbi:FAD-dependent oxidoreductase [Stutzerimonas kirkiae]|uniref:FAD-dependent oxidoreductase n=1 Tax=Stutzerimonas kirkiae TaxID=2211392 RepID=UPI00103833A5|nr:FAD-binding protein [Stutzerimonas kirkiae]TBV04185.1 oxidoreductase [Stutzerimonas kirkiae]